MEFDIIQRLRLFDVCEEGVSLGENYVVGQSEFDVWFPVNISAAVERGATCVNFQQTVDWASYYFNYNQSALKIGDSVAPTKLCKHINIRYHNVREKIVEGLVKLLYMCTRDMPADQLTKNLGFTQLQGHRSFINW